MIEQRLLVRQQPVMAPIELVNLGEPEIAARQIGERGAFEPLPMQPPLPPGRSPGAWRQQTIGDENGQFPTPPRALSARRQALRPEPIELQLFPQ